jgi:hypothetical protein
MPARKWATKCPSKGIRAPTSGPTTCPICGATIWAKRNRGIPAHNSNRIMANCDDERTGTATIVSPDEIK